MTLINRGMTLIQIAVSLLHQPVGVAEGEVEGVAEGRVHVVGQVHVVAEGGGGEEALVLSLQLQPLP